MEITIDLKSNCNNKCIFCSKNYWINIGWFTDFNKIKNKILNNKNNIWYYSIWWEEPFNAKELEKIILFIKKETNKMIIIKTSWVIGDINILDKKFIELIDIIRVPIHSLNEKEFNYIYWNKNAFSKYNLFLDKIKDIGLINRVQFHTLILKENFLFLHDILIYLNKKFWKKELVLVYPIKPSPYINNYYSITIDKNLILTRYKKLIDENIFKLINF